MAWLPDEIHDFYEDCKDKKSTAQSARHARSHCGKGGRVKFTSDYMTKKEREAMNGECKSYRMNDPISWEEFKTWPDEHKITYVKLLRAKYNVTDAALAEMMGIDRTWFKRMIVDALKLEGGKPGHRVWDKEGFYAWWHGAKGDTVKPSETPVEEDGEDGWETPVEEGVEEDELVAVNEESEIDCVSLEEGHGIEGSTCECDNEHTCSYTANSMPVIPSRGTLTFDNNAADDALATI